MADTQKMQIKFFIVVNMEKRNIREEPSAEVWINEESYAKYPSRIMKG